MFAVSHLKGSIEDGLDRQMWLITDVLSLYSSSHITYTLFANIGNTFDNFCNLLTNTNFPWVEFIVEHLVSLAESNQGECDGKLMEHAYLIYLRNVKRLL
jgi:hypothetical protein